MCQLVRGSPWPGLSCSELREVPGGRIRKEDQVSTTRPAVEKPIPGKSTKRGFLSYRLRQEARELALAEEKQGGEQGCCAEGCFTFSARAQGFSSWEAEQFSDLFLPLDQNSLL